MTAAIVKPGIIQPDHARAGVTGDVLILQNVYRDDVADTLDPDFTPYEGRHNARTEFREMGLFMRLYHNGVYRHAPYVGIVSPRFGQKLQLAGREFLDFIHANPGHDVYFINPFPQEGYYYFNVWEQCERHHPGCLALAQRLFDHAGMKIDLATIGRNSPTTLLYCNYWAGNSKFWDRFMVFNMKLINALYQLPPDEFYEYFSNDPRYPERNARLAFIFERTFSTFLLIEPGIDALAFPHSAEQVLRLTAMNDPAGLPFIRASKDTIDEIDRRAEYGERDIATLRALIEYRARL